MLASLVAHGVQPTEAWNMSLAECMAIANRIERNERRARDQQAMFAWKTAEMVGQYVAYMFAKSAPRPQGLYQAFPWLEKPEEDWQSLKARFVRKAETHNALYKRKETGE